MEKSPISEQSKITNENIFLQNRKSIKIEGLVEILSTNDNNITLKMKDTNLLISGNNISITKLDIATGILEAEGFFDNIKFGKSGNIFKRIFK